MEVASIATAFYPGAGTDLTPPVFVPEIKTWYYMDIQPFSNHGFFAKLNQVMIQCGFKLQKTEDNLCTYFSSSTTQTIYYETSTLFPQAWNPTKHAPLQSTSTLVLCGYDIEYADVLPPAFFPSFSHIITNSVTLETVFDKHVLPFHTFSRIEFPLSSALEYWLTPNKTKAFFEQFYSVTTDLKWFENKWLK